MQKLINKITADFPGFQVVASPHAHWSPKNNTVGYTENGNETDSAISLLHEIAHARLGHKSYKLDIELLIMEVEAWALAKKLAASYGINIERDTIEDCLDTYRDWVYRRSICPRCSCCGLQQNSRLYKCFNCSNEWRVSSSRFSRPYRLQVASNYKF